MQHMWAFAGRLQCLAHTYNSTNGNSSQDNSNYDSALNQPSNPSKPSSSLGF